MLVGGVVDWRKVLDQEGLLAGPLVALFLEKLRDRKLWAGAEADPATGETDDVFVPLTNLESVTFNLKQLVRSFIINKDWTRETILRELEKIQLRAEPFNVEDKDSELETATSSLEDVVGTDALNTLVDKILETQQQIIQRRAEFDAAITAALSPETTAATAPSSLGGSSRLSRLLGRVLDRNS